MDRSFGEISRFSPPFSRISHFFLWGLIPKSFSLSLSLSLTGCLFFLFSSFSHCRCSWRPLQSARKWSPLWHWVEQKNSASLIGEVRKNPCLLSTRHSHVFSIFVMGYCHWTRLIPFLTVQRVISPFFRRLFKTEKKTECHPLSSLERELILNTRWQGASMTKRILSVAGNDTECLFLFLRDILRGISCDKFPIWIKYEKSFCSKVRRLKSALRGIWRLAMSPTHVIPF